MTVIASKHCSKDVAQFLSNMGHGYSVGEKIAAGRRRWDELYRMLEYDQKARTIAYRTRRGDRGTMKHG
jgi:hypothetical protein